MKQIHQDGTLFIFLILLYFGIVVVAASIKYLLESFAYGKMFQKAGRKFGYAFIPFVRGWTLYQMVWDVKYYILRLILLILYLGSLTVLGFSGEGENVNFYMSIIMLAALIYVGIFILVFFVLHILFSIRISRAFSGGRWMTLGMIFFPTITPLIIGFTSHPYVGNISSKKIHDNKNMKTDT